MAKKKTTTEESEVKNQVTDNTAVNEEPKAMVEELFPLEELFNIKFIGKDGEICKVRRAFKPRGMLEIYKPEA